MSFEPVALQFHSGRVNDVGSFSVFESLHPFARVSVSVRVEEEPISISQPVLIIPEVIRTVGENHFADAAELSLTESSIVDSSVLKRVFAFSVLDLS